MQSFRTQLDARRQMFVMLAGQIEQQLREAYDRKFKAGEATQSSLAEKLGINRSAVHHRLMGHTNMTIETIADMVWALDHAIKIDIYDPRAHGLNHCVGVPVDTQSTASFPPSNGQPVGLPARPGLSPTRSTITDEWKTFVPQIPLASNVG